MKRYLALGAAVLFVASASANAVYAAGWSNQTGEWQYLNDDGHAVSDQWRKSNDGWYYLGDNGNMLKNTLLEDGDNYYYVDAEGRMVQNQWIAFDNTDEFDTDLDADQLWYYFGSDGKALRKKGNSFKKKVNGKTYIFDEDGVMLTGYFDDEGNSVNGNDDPFVDTVYYAGADGAVYENQWLLYAEHGGSDLENDMSSKGYYDYDEMWMYFDLNGKKVKSNDDDRMKQRTINGKTYGFDDNGIMLPWWEEVASSSNASAKYFSGYDGGHLLKETWFWMYPSEALASQAEANNEDYTDQECSWWRTDSNGRVIRNKIKEIGGKRYAFDDIGRMVTGFVLFDGRSDYVAQWEIDAWDSENFISGVPVEHFGFETSDLYLFGPDELNDGTMQTGGDIKVELADGVYTFGFSKNGKAYGNRNQLAKKNDRYYINGIRLEADSSLRYGVVEVSEGLYKVVDVNGKIVEGSKKILKDSDGGWFVIINDEFKAYIGDEDKPRWHKGSDGREGYYRYDSSNKENKYGDFIADKTTAPSLTDLPEEAKINFDFD